MAVSGTVSIPGRAPWNVPSPFRRIVRVAPSSADLTRRGVVPADAVRAAQLEAIARLFLDGYNAMFEARPLSMLSSILAMTAHERHGFVVEGAAMGAAVRDGLSVRAGLLQTLVARHVHRFEYLMAVGAGWAIARMPWRALRIRAVFDPLLGPLCCDGRGFHDLYFHPVRSETGALRKYRGAFARSYDAGIGRALWFVGSGFVARVVHLIARFPGERRPDLLSGVGLAMAYAGPATARDWVDLRAACQLHWAYIGQGVCFAAEALRCSGAIPDHPMGAGQAKKPQCR